MRLKAIRSHFADGIVREVGDIYETADRLAKELVWAKKAEPAPEKESSSVVRRAKPAKPAPMTTESAPDLISGAEESNHVE